MSLKWREEKKGKGNKEEKRREIRIEEKSDRNGEKKQKNPSHSMNERRTSGSKIKALTCRSK